MNDEFLTTSQVAALFGVSQDAVRRWDRNGIFSPSHRTPGGWRMYRKEDVEAFIEELGEYSQEYWFQKWRGRHEEDGEAT